MEILTLWIDGEKHTLHIAQHTPLIATVTVQQETSAPGKMQIEIIKIDAETKNITFRTDSKHFKAKITQVWAQPPRIAVLVYNTQQTIIIHLTSPGLQPKISSGSSTFHHEIRSPLAGRILSILVTEGQKVTKNQPLVIIESMKMENEIRTPHDAVIKTIPIKERDLVESGQVLFTLREDAQ